jgi:hypothetical protein
MDELLPVRDVVLEDITIDTVRGQENRYEHVQNVTETGIHISTFIEEPDKENTNV